MRVDPKEAHEVFIAFTNFQPSEMMNMTEKETLYWLDRVERAHKMYGLSRLQK